MRAQAVNHPQGRQTLAYEWRDDSGNWYRSYVTSRFRRAIGEREKSHMIYDSILGTIGRTPIVRIQRLAPNHATMYVKCGEFFNPLASVKDRLAIAIIEHAERTGALRPG
jgi:hypothetical protein